MRVYISSYDTDAPIGPLAPSLLSHDFYEIYCFLEGDAAYCVEGSRYALQPGDVVLIRKGEVHRVELLSSRSYRRMGVHFDLSDVPEAFCPQQLLAPFCDRSSGKFNHYPARLFPHSRWDHYLRQLTAHPDPSESLCYLLPLLRELADCFPTLRQADLLVEKDPVAPIMKYINNHLTEKLSLESLSVRFSVSQTHLNRLFRQSAGTSVWEYITIKRLALARELLDRGVSPTESCTLCGFQDYSAFFRAYKRHFGVCPSTHAAKRT